MAGYGSNFWKRTPFLKILLPFIAGIVLQWQFQFDQKLWWIIIGVCLLSIFIFLFLPFFNRYRLGILNGIFISLAFLATGALLAWQKDLRNNEQWLGNYYQPGNVLIVTLDEPPVEKTKSYKANASVRYIINEKQKIPVTGKVILYLKKDSSVSQLSYGSTILFKRPLQEIKNSGNPGGFDYKRYCLFKEITHQVYLKSEEFEVLPGKQEKWLTKFLIDTRKEVLTILRENIPGKRETALAEALLIGYKDDLDQALVQSYTNTGVVHIIAISGLHLGLIYWLLTMIFRPLKKKKKIRWLNPLLIITGLWLFALLAGAQPSVLRSALMFTAIVLGESFDRKTSVFNTMAVSAFILLCINPYMLWDVGFQLSYAAVSSIIIFMRPVYNWFYFKNKIVDFFWKLNAVTIAAQVLTVPLSIYHFHQFPTLFILTNFVAVPLASCVLIGEVFLCVISFIPALAAITGKALGSMIWLMNSYIEKIELISFSLWDRLQINIVQTLLLLLFAAGIAYWLMEKARQGLRWGIFFLFLFIVLRSYSFITTNNQKKIIVYNVPQKRAIDFVNGKSYFFAGDTDLLANDFARNFHLKPSRILFRTTSTDSISSLTRSENYFQYYGKHILLIDSTIRYRTPEIKPQVDLLIISKNPRLYMNQLSQSMNIKQVVFDGSVPSWKTTYWKKDCDSLKIPWHDVTTQGAFVMNL